MPSRSFSPVGMSSGKSKRKGSKKSGGSSRSGGSDPCSCCSKSLVFFILQWVVIVGGICAACMAIFNSRIVLHEAANDFDGIGGQHIYTMWDLSCYGLWGYRENCFKTSATWEELHCEKRKQMMIVGAVFLFLAIAFAIVVNIFMILGKCGCCKFPRLTILMCICAVVAFIICWAVLLGLFLSDTCESVIYGNEDYPLKNYTKLGPGYCLILAVFVLECVLLCLLFAWKNKLWIS